ncbi:hypothetical protein GOODEAATRI_030441, partial [Goodea atripinnis]
MIFRERTLNMLNLFLRTCGLFTMEMPLLSTRAVRHFTINTPPGRVCDMPDVEPRTLPSREGLTNQQ